MGRTKAIINKTSIYPSSNFASFKPFQNKDNFDVGNSNSDWKDQDDETMKKSIILLRRDSVQELFHDYYYDDNVAAALSL